MYRHGYNFNRNMALVPHRIHNIFLLMLGATQRGRPRPPTLGGIVGMVAKLFFTKYKEKKNTYIQKIIYIEKEQKTRPL